ncbi:MAG: hypothetical protein ACRDQ1_01820, partial [Sciscionella sp.]
MGDLGYVAGRGSSRRNTRSGHRDSPLDLDRVRRIAGRGRRSPAAAGSLTRAGQPSDGSALACVVGYTSNAHRTLRRGDSTVPEVKIAAEARTEFGKGAARRSRR